MKTGSIKFFNQEKGFGFIKPDDGAADVFFHVNQAGDMDAGALLKGRIVSYDTEISKKSGKLIAVNIKPVR
jgi:cold shock protein